LAIVYGYVLHAWTTTGMDSLFFGLCLFIADQFQKLERRIHELNDWEIAKYYDHFTAQENLKIKTRLIGIIKQYNRCAKLSADMNSSMSNLVLGQFVLASLQTAMSLFNFILATGGEKLTFACYASGSFMQMYFFCKCGTILADSVRETVYFRSKWF
jgi:7tm Odorant receptor